MKQNSTEKFNKGVVIKIILSVLAVGGLVALVAIAPNVLQILGTLKKLSEKRKKDQKIRIRTALLRLEEQGHIIVVNRKEPMIMLTKSGKRMHQRYQIKDLCADRSIHWDGKWRAIVFDIPEDKRAVRRDVRRILKECDFVYFQQSIWITPFLHKKVFDFLLKAFDLRGHIAFFTIEKIEEDKHLRKKFSL